MTSKELAEQLLKHPDFEVKFNINDKESTLGMNIRTFVNIQVTDVGHSDKVIILGGDED